MTTGAIIPHSKQPVPHSPEDHLSEGLVLIIDAIGIDATVDFILAFGGLTIWPRVRRYPEKIAAVIGEEKANALCRHLAGGLFKVPIARQWLARQLLARGWAKKEICVRLLCTEEGLRRLLQGPLKARGGGRGGRL